MTPMFKEHALTHGPSSAFITHYSQLPLSSSFSDHQLGLHSLCVTDKQEEKEKRRKKKPKKGPWCWLPEDRGPQVRCPPACSLAGIYADFH